MNDEILKRLPAREGHFLLESGYHTNLWLTLDALFVSRRQIAPLVDALAARLRTHDVSAVCGSLLGGAFLAQALATTLDVEFFFTEPVSTNAPGLFAARYRLPTELERRISGRRVAIVDDAISAGSSVRATVDAVRAAGATVTVVGALLALGRVGLDHFEGLAIPVEALARRDFALWKPSACPLCRAGVPLKDPSGSVA